VKRLPYSRLRHLPGPVLARYSESRLRLLRYSSWWGCTHMSLDSQAAYSAGAPGVLQPSSALPQITIDPLWYIVSANTPYRHLVEQFSTANDRNMAPHLLDIYSSPALYEWLSARGRWYRVLVPITNYFLRATEGFRDPSHELNYKFHDAFQRLRNIPDITAIHKLAYYMPTAATDQMSSYETALPCPFATGIPLRFTPLATNFPSPSLPGRQLTITLQPADRSTFAALILLALQHLPVPETQPGRQKLAEMAWGQVMVQLLRDGLKGNEAVREDPLGAAQESVATLQRNWLRDNVDYPEAVEAVGSKTFKALDEILRTEEGNNRDRIIDLLLSSAYNNAQEYLYPWLLAHVFESMNPETYIPTTHAPDADSERVTPFPRPIALDYAPERLDAAMTTAASQHVDQDEVAYFDINGDPVFFRDVALRKEGHGSKVNTVAYLQQLRNRLGDEAVERMLAAADQAVPKQGTPPNR
jgi:hypothetical protein